jgi:hypothetical protein
MKKNLIAMTILLLLLLSCKNKYLVGAPTKNQAILDTILFVDSLDFIDSKGKSIITEDIAQQTLDEYYSAKGVHNYKTGYQDEEGMQMCAYYDTLYRYNLNNDNHEDGIIEYHLMPCLASGHCYQPTHAIITKIKGKYKLISEEFLPSYFTIDTITFDKQSNYLYFYKFDCSDNVYTKHYRARIEKSN